MQEKTSHPTNIEGVDRRASQDEVIGAALAAGRSYDEAAAAANVSARTVRRRMADDRFAAEVRTLRAKRASRLSKFRNIISVKKTQVETEAIMPASGHLRHLLRPLRQFRPPAVFRRLRFC